VSATDAGQAAVAGAFTVGAVAAGKQSAPEWCPSRNGEIEARAAGSGSRSTVRSTRL